jgi:hypothetical protein
MTDRTAREGDWIFSLGGSLALTAGKRWPAPGGDGEGVFNGPFQLTLGAALQNVPNGDGPGWHLEAGVLDLAQYLSFQSEPSSDTEGERTIQVREPDLQDALAPSLKVGLQWGREVPVYAAVMGQYVPFYEFIEDDGAVDRHGALVLGVSFGAYVPLIDAN